VFDRDSQAVRSLPAGMAEGRGQCLHRENRLPAPGRVVVNILPVNGYVKPACFFISLSSVN
ncbi:hypothetical protein, partial [Aeromonas sp.]|uniref:hypothetical protein n=1 Tax=Aeromonas sp. TaxID=647 RepID=UPI002590CB58